MRCLPIVTTIVALLLSTIAAPAMAQDGENYILPSRQTAIRDDAKRVCPAAFKTDTNVYIETFAQDANYSQRELLLLQDFCIMYGTGYLAGRKG